MQLYRGQKVNFTELSKQMRALYPYFQGSMNLLSDDPEGSIDPGLPPGQVRAGVVTIGGHHNGHYRGAGGRSGCGENLAGFAKRRWPVSRSCTLNCNVKRQRKPLESGWPCSAVLNFWGCLPRNGSAGWSRFRISWLIAWLLTFLLSVPRRVWCKAAKDSLHIRFGKLQLACRSGA